MISKSAIVSKNLRIRSNNFHIGKYSVIDDFSYISNNSFSLGSFSHIGPNCCFAGGRYDLEIGNHVTIASHVSIYCESNNFSKDLVTLYSNYLNDDKIIGKVQIGNYCGVGSHSIILPNNKIPDGVSIGAFSLVPSRFVFEEYTYYSGIPIKPKKKKEKEKIILQAQKIENELNAKN